MKVMIEFNLEDYNDEKKLKRMINADSLCAYIYDVDQYIRTKYKYSDNASINIENLKQDLHAMKSEAVLLAMENY